MNCIYFIAGLLVLLFLLVDVFYTSFSLRGAGPLTAPTTIAFWKPLVTLSRSSRRKRLLANGGLLISVQTLLQWVVLSWLGHVLIAAAQYNSLIQAQTKAPATLAEKIYVVPSPPWVTVISPALTTGGNCFYR